MMPNVTSHSSSGGRSAIRVLVVEDDVDYRAILVLRLQHRPDIDIVALADDGAQALAAVAAHAPDVVLLDLRMPVMGGIEVCREIRASSPSPRILVLSASDEEADLFEAVRAGASGYLLKGSSGDEVAAGIRAVHNGNSLVSPSMAAKLLAEFASLSSTPAPTETIDRGEPVEPADVTALTDRELAVLRLMSRGLGNRDIAKELYISENTVKKHVRHILDKLQTHSRMEATMVALRHKIITPDE